MCMYPMKFHAFLDFRGLKEKKKTKVRYILTLETFDLDPISES